MFLYWCYKVKLPKSASFVNFVLKIETFPFCRNACPYPRLHELQMSQLIVIFLMHHDHDQTLYLCLLLRGGPEIRSGALARLIKLLSYLHNLNSTLQQSISIMAVVQTSISLSQDLNLFCSLYKLLLSSYNVQLSIS